MLGSAVSGALATLAPHAADASETAFLSVERSLTGRRWDLRAADERTILSLVQRFDVSEALARVLVGRGLGLDDTETFLRPTLRDLLPDPARLKDMETGAARLATAVRDGERIAVLADYDVDGATSAALLKRFFAALGVDLRVYVPDRLTEGYGPSVAAFERLREEGHTVVITVDCGISAFVPLAAARAAGLDVIVVDHHQGGQEMPEAVAVINPNRLDDDSGLGHLAAVGVAFLLAVAVNRRLRGAGWYRTSGRREPDLRQWLDLVALGTVCDMTPLIGVNRAFVVQGLKVMARRSNAGLRALADIARVDEKLGTYHLGFVFGPRINAGGRVGRADTGALLLANDDPIEAARLARCLDTWNRERQDIERAVLESALERLSAPGGDGDDRLVWAVGEGWHPGVVGIVASRLLERFHRPVIVLSASDDQAVASGRSVPGVDLGAAVNAAARAGLLIKGGGHAMAAGFTVARDRISALHRFLIDHLREAARERAPAPGLTVDGALALAGACNGLAQTLEAAQPFGIGNPEPRFAFANVIVANAAIVGGDHVRCTFADNRGNTLAAITFRSATMPLGQALLGHAGRAFHIVGRLRFKGAARGRGRTELLLDDAVLAGSTGG
jgi:single-stranded-DNA-specific exonuclease